MSGSTERVLIAPTSSAWPIPAHVDVRSTTSRTSDRSNTPFRRTLVYLLARSRGGHNRCRILKLLQDRGPLNANQIASALELHYTTVQHHLTKLARDDVVAASPRGESYGALFFLTYQMERNAEFLDRIPRAQLEAAGYTVSIWLVDGNSTDRTLEVGRKNGASVFIQAGRGKGNGMRQAFDHLLRTRDRADGGSREPEFFLMLDADGTYPPEAIQRFLEALASGNDVVLGSRFRGRMAEGAMTPLNAIGNRILSALARLLFGVSVTDVCTGMWGFKADALRRIPLEASGFDLEADLFGSACLSQARITELPIDYDARIGPAKMLPLRSGLQIALRLFVRRLNGPARPISRSRTEAPPGKQTAGLSRPEGMV